MLGWSQEELASAADVSLPTIKRLEAADGLLAGRQKTASKIQEALSKVGVEFIEENGGGPGVRLRSASGPRSASYTKLNNSVYKTKPMRT